MLGPSFKVARIVGIPIRVHFTLALCVPFLIWDFGLAMAVVTGGALFASIVLHELGHAVVAMRKGGEVQEILLLPIGGAARMSRLPPRPRDELLMAVAGPAVSLTLFLALYLGGACLPLEAEMVPVFGAQLHINGVQAVGLLNLTLAVFNLVPAFPMDGGRVLRALLAGRYGRLKATRIAAGVGRALAVVMGCSAVAEWLRGGPFSMLVFISIFIFWAAGMEYRAVQFQVWRESHRWWEFHP